MSGLPKEQQTILDKFSKLELPLVILVGIAYFLVAAWPSLQSDWMNCEDAAQHLIWLHDVDWPETYYTDVAKAIQPWGVQLLHGG